jgi:hypothetical protein
MNKRQAMRLALALEGTYIIQSDTGDAVTNYLSEKDIVRFQEAQREIGRQLLRRAGFDRPLSVGEFIKIISEGL